VGFRCADHVTPLYPQKLALIWPTCSGRSVGLGPQSVLLEKRKQGQGVVRYWEHPKITPQRHCVVSNADAFRWKVLPPCSVLKCVNLGTDFVMEAVCEENVLSDPWQEVMKCNRFASEARKY
jgi:hypothetical protein